MATAHRRTGRLRVAAMTTYAHNRTPIYSGDEAFSYDRAIANQPGTIACLTKPSMAAIAVHQKLG